MKTLVLDGRKYVLVPQAEWRRLKKQQLEPPMPPPNNDGTFPAVAAARVSIARTIIRRRAAADVTQKALAEAAGIRPESLNRIEKAKVTPDTATIARIDRALSRLEKQKVRQ